MKLKNENIDVHEGSNWGLPIEAVNHLGERLKGCWERFRNVFKTKTRDTSSDAYDYLSGQLRLDGKRNMANISREAGVENQNMQHFISNSPWQAQSVYNQVQEEIRDTPGLDRYGALILDESATEKAGERSAGTGKQYNGRLGKVETSQVGVFLAYANLKVKQSLWTWVDGELDREEA